MEFFEVVSTLRAMRRLHPDPVGLAQRLLAHELERRRLALAFVLYAGLTHFRFSG